MPTNEKPLYVRMDQNERRSVELLTLEVSNEVGRRIPLTEFVREAIAYASENKAVMCRRLKKKPA